MGAEELADWVEWHEDRPEIGVFLAELTALSQRHGFYLRGDVQLDEIVEDWELERTYQAVPALYMAKCEFRL